MEYTNITVETRENLGIITLNRPQALNAVNAEMLKELALAAEAFDNNDAVRVLIVKGDGKTFAAGIDIKEVLGRADSKFLGIDEMQNCFRRFAAVKKPIIAAVSGYALGIGCELALACDIILAADNTRFGQPELSLGTIPAFGATQRLTRALGKAKAMEMILSGRALTAEEAFVSGLISRIVPLPDLFEDAAKTAARIATQPLGALKAAKEAVLAAQNTPLEEGIAFERKAAQCCLAADEFRESLRNFAAGQK
ncbi:MAG: enoyl-CoA hydratase-related protein [Alphaproteobacteria bacterium]|jgi:enoyl-coA hydratase/isomerase family protein|uniref:enoyl-CoA hydratase-related protein n=1 Tax=Candidatus Scatocola faecigallinarum TaxID=2840916 RepID=UPI003A404786